MAVTANTETEVKTLTHSPGILLLDRIGDEVLLVANSWIRAIAIAVTS
jgi:hypothetical protein